jgi:hypothetical protein
MVSLPYALSFSGLMGMLMPVPNKNKAGKKSLVLV